MANDVTIEPGATPGTVRIGDTVDTVDVTAAPGCTIAFDGHSADCATAATVTVDLGDGDDTLSASASPVGLEVDGGPGVDTITTGAGDDVLHLQDGEADAAACGTGADDASDADAQDALDGCEETPATAGPPGVSITPGDPALITRQTTATFAFGATEPVARYDCSLDGASFDPCTTPTTYTALAEGAHTLLVRAVDLVGNTGTPTRYTWTQDSVRPQTTLTSGPATSAPVNSAAATLAFASQTAAAFECSLDGAGWQPCVSPVTYGGLANGRHTFAVRAVDAAGNVDGTPATRAWTVNVDGAPTARIAVTADGDGFALSAAGSSDPEGGRLTYRWQRNGNTSGTAAAIHYAAPGHETRDVFMLTVTDPAGQRGQAVVALRTHATRETAAHQAMEVIRFRSGSRLAPGASARIAALRTAVSNRGAQVRIDGYASASPDASAVSTARARAVRRLLAKGAGPAAAFTVAGRGAATPAASNATAAGRARNDRVVVTVDYQGPAERLVTEQEGAPAVRRSTAPEPAAPRGRRALKLFAFWSAVPGALERLEEVGGRVDVLAPNWYTLSPGSAAIRGGAPNAKVMALSRRLRFAVWPVVNATMHGSPLIDSAAGRAKVVKRIGALAARHRLQGVTLDMEEMLPRQQASFSALVTQLASALHAKDRKLAVYAVRRTATVVGDSAAAYDWAALAGSADLVLASGYNEHSATTDPGPVTTQAGFDAVAGYAAATSAAKIAPTMGAFGYRWSAGGARMVSSADAERRFPVRAEAGSANGRSATSASGETFFESAEDLWARERAASTAGARWIGLFTLGREPERFWERSLAR
jgi:outer membrane protein OmpA-like peptidoglycan-associated protein